MISSMTNLFFQISNTLEQKRSKKYSSMIYRSMILSSQIFLSTSATLSNRKVLRIINLWCVIQRYQQGSTGLPKRVRSSNSIFLSNIHYPCVVLWYHQGKTTTSKLVRFINKSFIRAIYLFYVFFYPHHGTPLLLNA